MVPKRTILLLFVSSCTNSRHRVAESEGQFPPRLLFEVFGDEKLQKFNIQMDNEVIIQFEPNARESKGAWFASNRAYDVLVGTQQITES
jgi:hypothetical protein